LLLSKKGFLKLYNLTLQNSPSLINLSTDYKSRFTIWNCVLSSTLAIVPAICFTQQSFDHIKSSPTVNSARLIVLGIVPFAVIQFTVVALFGSILFGYLKSCSSDDFSSVDSISNQNNLIPKFFVKFFSQYYGFLGFYISLLTSSTLTTVSRLIRSLSTTLSVDIVKRALSHFREKRKHKEILKNNNEHNFKSVNGISKNRFMRRQSRSKDQQMYEVEMLTLQMVNVNSTRKQHNLLKKFSEKRQNRYVSEIFDIFATCLCGAFVSGFASLIAWISSFKSQLTVHYYNDNYPLSTITENNEPNTLVSIGLSLMFGPIAAIFFIFICARFNEFSIKRNKYAINTRSTASRLRHFRIYYVDLIIACLISIVITQLIFIGRLRNVYYGNYNYEKMNSNLSTLTSLSSNKSICFLQIDTSLSSTSSSSIIQNNNSNFKNVDDSHNIFSISYNWYPMLTFVCCILVIISCILIRNFYYLLRFILAKLIFKNVLI
jgi:hypothetical protein